MNTVDALGFLWITFITVLVLISIYLMFSQPNILKLEEKMGKFLYLFSYQNTDDYIVMKRKTTYFQLKPSTIMLLQSFLLEIAIQNNFKEKEKIRNFDEFLKIIDVSKMKASELSTINFSSKERKKHNEYRKIFLQLLDKLNYNDENTIHCLKNKFIEIYNQL